MNEDADLTARLRSTLRGARAVAQTLPDCPGVELYLINADFPQGALSAEEQQAAMERPAYWAFCWPSGQILADYLLRNPELVRGKRVLDFGPGSGVVAVAAALAGAAVVWACDLDPDALAATAANAALNGVSVECVGDVANLPGTPDLITAADVFYDPENTCWWQRFLELSPRVLAADCRAHHPPEARPADEPTTRCSPRSRAGAYRLLFQRTSGPVPAMDICGEFRNVSLFLGQAPEVA